MTEMQDLQELRTIGQNIKTMRTRCNVSQCTLAQNINVSQTHLSNIENGKTGVSLAIIIRISKSLGCSLDSLIYGSEYEPPEPAKKMLTDCTVTDLSALIHGIVLDMFVNSMRQTGAINSQRIPQIKGA